MITRQKVLKDFDISIHKHGEKQVFHDANRECNPTEDQLVVKKTNGGYEVYIEHRNSREEIGFERSEEAAMIWGLLTYLRRFKSVIDQKKSNLILECEEQGDQDSANQIMQEVSDYIFAGRKANAISYRESKGVYTISYDDTVLCENIDGIRFKPVLYNFASLLKFIDVFECEYADYMKEAGIDLDEAKRFFVTRKR